jgi:uncharacterized membrane protein
MKTRRRAPWLIVLMALLALVFLPAAIAFAGPRSGGSFGGRPGFRSGGGSFSMPHDNYSGGRGYGYGGGSHFFFMPGWGWGGGYGYGGGFGIFGTLVVVAVAGIAIASVVRAVRRARGDYGSSSSYGYDDSGPVAMPDRAYLYRLQLGLGRSARGVQDRLAEFAAQGDTSSEAGLGALLQQTALELLRQKDSIRYAAASGKGPMSLTNAETAMNGLALAERSRFQVERVRAADGRVNRSTAAAEEGAEALELVVVTVVVATRTQLAAFKSVTTPAELATLLSELGALSPEGLLGLEVIWTPADPNDSMTETDVMTTYPELRSL